MAATTSSSYKRGLVRSLEISARNAGITLQDALNALLTAKFDATAGGLVVKASANGHSYEFQATGFTQVDLAETVSELLDLYDAAVVAGQTTDSGIAAWIRQCDALNPPGFEGFRPDFSIPAWQTEVRQ